MDDDLDPKRDDDMEEGDEDAGDDDIDFKPGKKKGKQFMNENDESLDDLADEEDMGDDEFDDRDLW